MATQFTNQQNNANCAVTNQAIKSITKKSKFSLFFGGALMVGLLITGSTNNSIAQVAQSAPIMQDMAYAANANNIFNYTTVYNSGKVFVNWTAKDEPADCIYIVERSGDGRKFESVGVKEGIGTNLELFYSWMDHTPPAGFAYYRVKKITKDGAQMYSATNTIINQGSSFDKNSNYAKGAEENKDMK